MSRFIDEYSPPCMPGYPCVSSPRWSTMITRVSSGAEQVLQNWTNPLYKFVLPEAVRTQEVYEACRDMWLAMRGPVHTWPFRDPLDFASRPLVQANIAPAINKNDQYIGVGDGARTRWPINKLYSVGSQTYLRRIHLVVEDSELVSVDGLLVTSGYTITRPGGEIVFDVAPSVGDEIRMGFLFDVEVRFESDDTFDGIIRSYAVSGFADINLVEVRPC